MYFSDINFMTKPPIFITGKKCIKCEPGFFSDKTDAVSKCQKWKE